MKYFLSEQEMGKAWEVERSFCYSKLLLPSLPRAPEIVFFIIIILLPEWPKAPVMIGTPVAACLSYTPTYLVV